MKNRPDFYPIFCGFMVHLLRTTSADEYNIEIVTEFLEGKDFEIFIALDGVEAWKIIELEKENFDVILLDRMMSKLSGAEFMSKLKKTPIYAKVPVVVQTAAATAVNIKEGMRAGVFYYLTKPYDANQLLNIIYFAVAAFNEQYLKCEKLLNTKRCSLQDSEFSFATIEEAKELAQMVAASFLHSEKVVLGLFELMANAVEHGNLGISYDEKKEALLANTYIDELQNRYLHYKHTSRKAKLKIEDWDECFYIHIIDQGSGFDWKSFNTFDPKRLNDPNGRGIMLASTCFKSLEYKGLGNHVVCCVEK